MDIGEWPDEYPEAFGHLLKALLEGPPNAYTFEPPGDRFADCLACGTAWDDCEASQPYADEEDLACCGGCEHAWVPPPPTYTVINGCGYWVLDQRGAPLYLEVPPPGTLLSSSGFFAFDEPVVHLEGGPWRAVDTLREPFVPWKASAVSLVGGSQGVPPK